MKITIHEAQHQGTRDYQEDRYWYHQTPERTVIVLADGMGGMGHGDEAADACIAACQILENKPLEYFTTENINEVFYTAHKACMNSGNEWDSRGSTFIICLITQDKIRFWNVGDSFGYCIDKDNTYTIAKSIFDSWIGAYSRASCKNKYSWYGLSGLEKPLTQITYTEIDNNNMKYVVIASDGIENAIVPQKWGANRADTILKIGMKNYFKYSLSNDNTTVVVAELKNRR